MLLPAYPFSFLLNPHIDSLHEEMVRWVQEFPLSDEEKEKIIQSKFAWLAARTYPEASYEQLRTFCRLALFFFLNDDMYDFHPPEEVAPVYAQYIDILYGNIPLEKANWLCDLLIGLSSEVSHYLSDRWYNRFCTHFRDYLMLTLKENNFRINKTYPGLDSYLHWRLEAGAMLLCFDYIEVSTGLELAESTLTHPTFGAMIVTANNISILCNDIYSLRKDAGKEVFNYAIIYSHEHHCDLTLANEKMIALHDREVQRFLQLRRSLLNDPIWNDSLCQYITGLEKVMYANLLWMEVDSNRYK